MQIEEFNKRRQTRSKVNGIAAALLPYKRDGESRSRRFRDIWWPRITRG